MSKANLRSLTVGAKKVFNTEIVVYEGASFEVRAPSVKVRNEIAKLAGAKPGKDADKLDMAEMQVISVICMTFDPESGEQVFELADKDSLLNSPASGYVDLLAAACMRMMGVVKETDEEGKEKN